MYVQNFYIYTCSSFFFGILVLAFHPILLVFSRRIY